LSEAKIIPLAIRDFALPVPRRGSIEALSGYSRVAQQEGQEIHLMVQERRAAAYSSYESEVKISHTFEHGGYAFEIGGRIDGLFRRTPPKIEEIKSTFNVHELSRKLEDAGLEHPYGLQLATYGYFYWLEHSVKPDLAFHLVSTRNGETRDLDVKLDIEEYEKWLKLRLDELAEEVAKAEKRAARRRKIAQDFPFPFEKPRPGQKELIQTIETSMKENKRLMIQAPTGLGKTAGVLYPSMKEAMSRGQKVIYVTPKNSQHSVAEDAIERFQDTGSAVKSLTITAKAKICFKNEPLCNPEYCEFARDYYTKLHEHKLADQLAKKKKLTSKVFKKMGEEYEVCPFELQLEAAQEADAVICDYNYVIAPRSSMGALTLDPFASDGKPNLVIDEAHNLPSRAMDHFSPALSSITLEHMREDVMDLTSRFRKEAEELIDECIEVILSCKPDEKKQDPKGTKIEPSIVPFIEQDSKLRAFLSRYLDSTLEIQPKDVILRFCFYWAQFTEALEFVISPDRKEFFTTFHPHSNGGTIKITCCDASSMLRECYDDYQNVVAFSATLKPFEFYSKLSGLDSEKLSTAEFQSPFSRENRKLVIIPQVSTKYSERERNYGKVAEAIRRITELRPGNYFAFFPSFEFLERTLDLFIPASGFTIRKQERNMRTSEIEEIIDHLKSLSQPTIVFAVQGGVFSEGVDYPGETVIGAFVIGPPLPSFNLEREEMRKYYDEYYGAGFDYAYSYPAMAKAIQSAGRVIRSETDRGLIVLMDNRFIQPSYARSMPTDWFKSSPQELVVSSSLLREISEFWQRASELAQTPALDNA
jgi:DNA excision repair protein ERCC-2